MYIVAEPKADVIQVVFSGPLAVNELDELEVLRRFLRQPRQHLGILVDCEHVTEIACEPEHYRAVMDLDAWLVGVCPQRRVAIVAPSSVAYEAAVKLERTARAGLAVFHTREVARAWLASRPAGSFPGV